MINNNIYTRMCNFCTSILTVKTLRQAMMHIKIGMMSICGLILFIVADVSAADNTCPSASYYIQNIETSALAETSEEARGEATSSGLIKAWSTLQQRLLISGQNTPEISTIEEILPLLDYTRIVSEIVLPSRYQAVFDYCFDRLKIRDYFAKHDLRHAELMSGPILLLPVWVTPEGPHLWRTPNPWAESWVRLLGGHEGLLDLRLPSSLATERSIDVIPLLARDHKTLATAAHLEKTERILLMVMTPKQDGNGLSVDVEANLYNKNGKFDAEAYRLENAALDPDDITAAIDGIVVTLLSGVEDVWRNTNVVNIQDSGVLVLSVKANSLKEWRSSLDILVSLPPVEKLSVIKLASNGGLVQIKLGGSITSLNYALEGHGLTLEEHGANDQSYLSLVRIVN